MLLVNHIKSYVEEILVHLFVPTIHIVPIHANYSPKKYKKFKNILPKFICFPKIIAYSYISFRRFQ